MSAPSSWLQKQRKSDLQALAEQVGLKDYETLKKTELEYALDDHMRANQTRLSKDSSFEVFYRRLQAATSPVKKTAVAILRPATDEHETEKKKPRPRRSIKAREELHPPSDPSSPSSSGATSPALKPRTPRALTLSLPASPSLVADTIDQQTASLRSSLHALYRRTGLVPRAERLRDALSTVAAIQTLALALEACGLARDVLPLRYLARVPAVRALGTGSHAVRIPDLFALLTAGFWGPVAVWVVVGVVVPVMGGWFFNVGLGAGRRGGGRRTVDPLAFAVVRGLLAWAVYGRGVGAEWVGREWVVGVEGSVPAGWRGMCVGAGVGGVMAVYEAVLRG